MLALTCKSRLSGPKYLYNIIYNTFLCRTIFREPEFSACKARQKVINCEGFSCTVRPWFCIHEHYTADDFSNTVLIKLKVATAIASVHFFVNTMLLF